MLAWWLVRVKVVKLINNYKVCFLFKLRSLDRMLSDFIFQTICFQVLSFGPYAFKSYLLGHMFWGLIFQVICLEVISFRLHIFRSCSSSLQILFFNLSKFYLLISYTIKLQVPLIYRLHHQALPEFWYNAIKYNIK